MMKFFINRRDAEINISPVGRGRYEVSGEGHINIAGKSYSPLTQPSPHRGEGLLRTLCALCVSAVLLLTSFPPTPPIRKNPFLTGL
jgi:hypothetical protein